MDKNHTPDAIYLIKLLGSLNPNHAIFAKDYVPDPKDRGRNCKRAENEVHENYSEPSLGVFEEGLPTHLLYNPPSKSKRAKAKEPEEESKGEFHQTLDPNEQSHHYMNQSFFGESISTSSCPKESFSRKIPAFIMLLAAISPQIQCSRCCNTCLLKALPVPTTKGSKWCSICSRTS